MSLILTKEELSREIERFNSGGRNPYYVVCDFKFSRELYDDISQTRGVVALPTVADDKLAMLYYVSDEWLYKIVKEKIDTNEDFYAPFKPIELRILIKRKGTYGHKLFGRNTLLRDLVYFYQKGYIDENFVLNGSKYKDKSRLYGIIAKVPLDKMEVLNEYVVVDGVKVRDGEIIVSRIYPHLYLNIMQGRVIADRTQIKGYLEKMYLELKVHIQAARSNKNNYKIQNKPAEVIHELYNVYSMSNVKEIKCAANNMIEFLLNFDKKRIKLIDTDILEYLGKHHSKFAKEFMCKETRKFVKDFTIDRVFENVEPIKEEILYLRELQTRIYCYNVKHIHKLYLDKNFSEEVYRKLRTMEGVIPSILYLRGTKNFVVVYQAANSSVLDMIQESVSEIEHSNKLSDESIDEICNKELELYQHLALKSQSMLGIKFLHKAGKVKSEQFLGSTKKKPKEYKSLRDIYKFNSLDNVIIKGHTIYIKLKGSYNLKPFLCMINKVGRGYETVVKICAKDFCIVDKLIADLYEVGVCERDRMIAQQLELAHA